MPELPEVETTRLGMLPLLNQVVSHVVIRNPSLRWPIPAQLTADLVNQPLLELSRRAKYILARFPNGTLILHLGMSGRICLLTENEAPAKHDHFDIHFQNGLAMRLRDPRRFGAVLWAGLKPEEHVLIKNLGPEPLNEGFDGEYLYQKIRNKSAPIKNVIMDGHVVVGVGNIYASESLYRSSILPTTPANKVTKQQCDKLVIEIQTTLKQALIAGGSTLRDFFGANGTPGYFQQEYFVYGRTGQPCKRCNSAIEVKRIGQRSTFYCPACQK